jgi:uncharacterized protein YifN (PemK superfamily)
VVSFGSIAVELNFHQGLVRLCGCELMAITFDPERGRILMCNYDMARVPPEMDKLRRVVVISPKSHNHRHGASAGRCVVVTFSATDPDRFLTPAEVPFPANRYRCLTVPTWAICSAVMSVSHDRLDRHFISKAYGYSTERLTPVDMLRIENGLRHALGTVPVS